MVHGVRRRHRAPGSELPQASAALHSASFRSLAETRTAALEHGVSWWSITSLATDEELLPDVDVLNLHAREPRGYQGDVAEMMDFIGSRVRDQWRIVVVTEGPGPAQRLAELFHDNDIPCARVDALDDEPQAGLIEVTTAAVGRGFVLDPLKLALLTEADLLGRTSAGSTKDMRRMPSKRRNAVDPLQLVAGDSVVHEQHGIGRFVELIQRKVAGGRRRRPRIPGPGIRAVQARRPGRPALRAHRPAGPGHPLRRRGHPRAEQDGRRGLGQHQVQGPQGGQGNRRRAHPAVLGPDGVPRPRLRARTPRGSASWRRPSRTWRPRTS